MYDPTKPYTKQILKLIKQTWETPYISVEKSIVKKKFSYKEYHHTDGIGTKGFYHWKNKTFENAVTDAMAMNLNDLAMMRATPYAVIDHLFLPEDNQEYILRIIKSLTEQCKKRNIAITGGETAIHDTHKNEIELSITMLGFIKNPKPNNFKIGDFLIGIESNGLHSNGFTKIREIFDDEYNFTAPTYIYLDLILELNEKFDIHGMMHITGGAYTKLKDLLNNADVHITKNHKLKPHQIFKKIYEKNISDEEMYKIFNCGIGFILSVSPENANEIISNMNKKGFNVDIIGEIIPGNEKIKIKSMFSDKEIVL